MRWSPIKAQWRPLLLYNNLQIAIYDKLGYYISMRQFNGIKPQDILIMLKLVIAPRQSQKELATSLFISQAEISHGIKRLKQAQLINSAGQVVAESCVEFVVHGLKYMCPAELGPLSSGIPTAFAHPDFKYVRYSESSIYIWPWVPGKKKGDGPCTFL